MAAISSSNTDFALELFRTLSQANPSGNIFLSPLSISSALAMVYLGAEGDTAAQMAKVSSAHSRRHLISCCDVRQFLLEKVSQTTCLFVRTWSMLSLVF